MNAARAYREDRVVVVAPPIRVARVPRRRPAVIRVTAAMLDGRGRVAVIHVEAAMVGRMGEQRVFERGAAAR